MLENLKTPISSSSKRFKLFKFSSTVTLLLILLVCSSCGRIVDEVTVRKFIASGRYSGPYWPTTGWRSCSPEEVGLASDILYQAFEYASSTTHNTHGLIIIKDGYIVGEEYLNSHDQNSRFPSYSVAKSVLSGLFGIAIAEGTIPDLDTTAFTFLSRWQKQRVDPLKQTITMRHLLGMASGIEWNEDYTDPGNDIQRMVQQRNYLNYVLDLPLKHVPFTDWQYNTGNSIILSGILQNASGLTAYEYAKERMFGPLGMTGTEWEADPSGRTVGGWGILTTLRNYAKFAYLYLKDGQWESRQILSRDWIRETTGPITNFISFYGLHWWLFRGFDEFPGSGLAANIYLAQGIHGQLIYIIPDANIIAVKTGFDSDPLFQSWNHVTFLKAIMNSLQQ